jgi:predicted glutamine amidotransferase
MCGLVGMVVGSQAGSNYKDMQAFEDLLYIDALRGEDSTGIGYYDADGGIRLLKKAVDAAEFLKTNQWSGVKMEMISKGKAIIGHNRKKTVGKIEDATAHPFLIDNRFLFMHNGTLSSHKHLADTEVDSEALGMVLTKCEGDKEKLEETLAKVYGAYACVWIDKVKEKLYMLRNRERPLVYGKIQGGWVFSSEMNFARLCFLRQGGVNNDVKEITELPVDTLVSFDLSIAHPEPVSEALTIKKYSGQYTTPTVLGSDSTGTTTVIETVSKNQFKRLSKKMNIGDRLSFFMEDYHEMPNQGSKERRTFHILGKSLDLAFPHKIFAIMKDTTEKELLDWWTDCEFEGEINNFAYRNKSVEIFVTKLDVLNYGMSAPSKDHETPTNLQ